MVIAMKKDLSHVCDYLKALVIPHLPDDFVVAERFRHGLTNDEIRKGIAAYREFLRALFDMISISKDKIDVARGSKYDPYGTKGDRGTSSVKECFPVFFDTAMILLSLGFHGRLQTKPEMRLTVCGEDMSIVICPITEKYQSLIKMSNERKMELFRLLSDLGLRFSGADFSEEVDFKKAGTFYVTSSQNEYFTVGLKLIADAATNIKDHYKMENLLGPVILRGDFQSLTGEKPKKYVFDIRDFANAQPPEIGEWLMNADTLLLNSGCTMIQGMGGGPPFTYAKRNTTVTKGMVCIIEADYTGCFVIPGVNHLANPDSIINMLPDDMVDTIKSGEERTKFNIEQCNRRSGNMGFARFAFTHNGNEFEGCRHAGLRCQFSGVKCRFTGFKFDLSNPNVRELMMKWIEMELTV
jgi:hypothetical protein